MQTNVYVHGSKESMYEHGRKLGLIGDALNMFSYTGCEVELTVVVNEQTGESTIVAVDGLPVAISTQQAHNAIALSKYSDYLRETGASEDSQFVDWLARQSDSPGSPVQ